MINYYEKEPQIKAPRVTPLEGVSTSTVAPVDVAHTYGSPPYVDIAARYAPQGIRVRGVENPQGFGIDERRFIGPCRSASSAKSAFYFNNCAAYDLIMGECSL